MSKLCILCGRTANYNYPGQYRLYCGEHKLPAMINVVSARCVHTHCTKGRVYNYPGFTSKYCGVHRLEGMINCSRPKCKKCNSSANYGYDNRRDYCYRHKDPLMDKYKK